MRKLRRARTGSDVLRHDGTDADANLRERVPHKKILDALDHGPEQRGIVEVYGREVLPVKTRTIHLLGRKTNARVIHTLLGYEVQASYKRIHCPDMATARYLKLFSELGCRTIKLPYDPTTTARLLPELEGALESISRGVKTLFPGDAKTQIHVLERVYRLIRKRLRLLQAAAMDAPQAELP
jgi:hypothetical protein